MKLTFERMIRSTASMYGIGMGLAATALFSGGMNASAYTTLLSSFSPRSAPVPTRHPASELRLSQAASPLTNTTVVPGQSIGPITLNTSYQDLVKIFGPQRLSDVRPSDADDTEREFGTRINLGPDWSLTIVWTDKTKTKPYQAMDLGPGWKLPADLKEGMPMAQVQQKIGAFQLVGLGGPYGGIIPLQDTALQNYFGKLIVQLTQSPGADKQFASNYQAVSGERLIASTDPNWKPLGMKVKYLIVLFQHH
ncbi:MAG TPA: hypothetical protein V6D19_04265 [Stenomitos sp.]